MSAPPATYSLDWFGDRFLRVSVGERSNQSLDLAGATRAACDRLLQADIPGLIDIAPAGRSALLSFELRRLCPAEAERAVADALRAPSAPASALARLVEIPVCYEPAFAPDAEGLAAELGVRTGDIATLHSGAEHRVEFLGFMPGFAYLSGLPAALHAPRLPRPRTRVPAGSVGIAGDKSGIYPSISPGGWRLIGQTPLRIFDPTREPPTLLLAGDSVRFRIIAADEFTALAGARR